SRKVVSKWCNRRTTEEALSVLTEWVELYGKPMKVMHDGGKELDYVHIIFSFINYAEISFYAFQMTYHYLLTIIDVLLCLSN
ncbi:MAG: hypothetical protein WBF33_26630, partial [Candidatus Nitrosopolaris sp.]